MCVNIVLQSVVIVKSVVFIKTHTCLNCLFFFRKLVFYNANNKLSVKHHLKEITYMSNSERHFSLYPVVSFIDLFFVLWVFDILALKTLAFTWNNEWIGIVSFQKLWPVKIIQRLGKQFHVGTHYSYRRKPTTAQFS